MTFYKVEQESSGEETVIKVAGYDYLFYLAILRWDVHNKKKSSNYGIFSDIEVRIPISVG